MNGHNWWVEQVIICDCENYDVQRAARDAILFQMDDKKLWKKIIALQEVIKLGIASEQAAKAADRIRPSQQGGGGRHQVQ